MTTDLRAGAGNWSLKKLVVGFALRLVQLHVGALAAMGLLFTTGCQTSEVSQIPPGESQYAEAITLREGDIVKITFPGESNLDSTQQIRRDGKISLAVLGEIKAAGLTPSELEKEILKQAASQLVTKEVTVTLQSSSFPVFVTGAVVRPGKVVSDHQITALEAIMEAGGFDYSKANLVQVRVIRHEGGQVKTFTLNLKQVLDGKQSTPFYLKPSDIVYVPAKFSWF